MAQVLTNKILAREVASAKYQTRTIEKRSAPQSPRNYSCPFSSVYHYTPVARQYIRTAVWVYCATTVVVLYCTTLLYCTTVLLHCSVAGTVLLLLHCTTLCTTYCGTVLCCCALLLYRTTVPSCTRYCATVYQVYTTRACECSVQERRLSSVVYCTSVSY